MSRTLAKPDLIGQKAPWPARGWDQSFFRSAEVDSNKVALSPSILPGHWQRIVSGRLGTRSTELYDLSILRIRLGLLFFLEPWRDIKLNYLGHNILLIGERAHFYKPHDHCIGEIEEAKLARFQVHSASCFLARVKNHHQHA